MRKTILSSLFGSACFGGMLFAHSALAASLYLSPEAGSYAVGRTFTIGIYVSSPDEAMNTAQATLVFPTDKLAAISISKNASIMNLWVQDPSFSNRDGTVHFGAVVVNPGYRGTAGNILNITFQAKESGVAHVSFSSGSVLANDGKGTDILLALQGANFTLASAAGTPVAQIAPMSEVSAVPAKSSSPQFADNQWENLNAIRVGWRLPANADGVDYAISNDPAYVLPDVSRGLVSSVIYDTTTMADGIWYFFVSIESDGVWSPPAARILRLDRTPPDSFVVVEKDAGTAMLNPNPAFQWAATDKTSGIAYYRAKIGAGDWFDPNTIAQGSLYVLPPQLPTNSRTLTVRAYDNAGNFTDESINFKVIGTCDNIDARCVLESFLAHWMWLFIPILIAIMILAYWFLYRAFRWKRILRAELGNFKKEFQSNLKRLEERMGSSADGRSEMERFLKKETEQIRKETEKEIEKIKKITKEK